MALVTKHFHLIRPTCKIVSMQQHRCQGPASVRMRSNLPKTQFWFNLLKKIF